jgi:hypothetical protein
MSIQSDIESAFAHRKRPTKLIELQSPTTPEQNDAMWFKNRDWREIDWKDWEAHSDAIFAFVPEAFIYYLPSILTATLNAPNKQLLVADFLIGTLDRSPEPYHWDKFITDRFIGLEAAEYQALKDWILDLSGQSTVYSEDSLTRSFETTELFARETSRLRKLMSCNPGEY